MRPWNIRSADVPHADVHPQVRQRDSVDADSPCAITALTRLPVAIRFSSGKTSFYDTGADERLMHIFINECPAHALSSRSDVLASASLKGHIALWVLNNDWVPGQPILIGPGEDNSVKVLKQYCITFGFDEEVSGLYGAYEIGKHLEATYGKDALAMVVDEGGGFSKQYGGVFAVPAVGEKGYFDTLLEIKSPGGHSSVPPVHTSIGILSALLVEYETHPIPAVLDRTTPFYGMLQCFAAHAPDMDSKPRKTVQQSASSDKALHELEKVIAKDKALRALVGTTQAIDLIQGDVKTNALPEQRGLSSIIVLLLKARSRRPRSMIPSSWSNSPRNSA